MVLGGMAAFWRRTGTWAEGDVSRSRARRVVRGAASHCELLPGGRQRALADTQAVRGDEPLGSVVIPAYNEANVVERTLTHLFRGVDPRALEVVVACNGCTDGTATVATEIEAPVTVLDLPAVGKAGAIRAAELEVRTLPRLYLDADVRLDGSSAVAVLTALRNGAVAARPPLRYDTTGASWLVKRYYDQRVRLPAVRTDLCGAGVYGLSAAARARFDDFPDVIADDLFAARIVEPSEVTIVPCAPVSIRVPLNVRSLLRTLVRAHRGNRELADQMPALARSTTNSTVRQLLRSMVVPARVIDAAVYAGVMTLGRLLAKRRDVSWGRDETSRRAT
jgi:glycosyltransferase involved in cell wall biosynthesis